MIGSGLVLGKRLARMHGEPGSKASAGAATLQPPGHGSRTRNRRQVGPNICPQLIHVQADD